MRLRNLACLAALLFFFAAVSAQPVPDQALKRLVEERLSEKNSSRKPLRFVDVCPVNKSVVAERVFREYGAMFAADDSLAVPRRCIYASELEVQEFQATLKIQKERIAGAEIELQEEAMEALLEAIDEATERGLRITPLDGSIAGRRSFADTERLWRSRFLPALNHWIGRGKITREEADRVRSRSILPQVEAVFAWEARGYFFSTGKNKPIMSSVAPPGTSQHLSLLAFDVEQAGNHRVREILNRNGWYQTVIGDPPHFTYLGVSESKLPQRGLVKVISGGIGYWVPRVVPYTAPPSPVRVISPST